MPDKAETAAFRHRVMVDGDRLTYNEAAIVDIYGRRFEHADTKR